MRDPSDPGLPPGAGTKLTVAAVLLLFGVGMAVYSFVLRDTAVNEAAKVAVTVVGVVLLILSVAGAYALYRLVFPPKAGHLRISVAGSEVRRGSEVTVSLEVQRSRRTSKRLELGLVCTEYYEIESGEGRATRQAVAHADWRPHTEGRRETVRFEVPIDAPFSYRGRYLSFVWQVSAREPRRMRFDRATSVPLVVRP
jgi:hypothetical protein